MYVKDPDTRTGSISRLPQEAPNRRKTISVARYYISVCIAYGSVLDSCILAPNYECPCVLCLVAQREYKALYREIRFSAHPVQCLYRRTTISLLSSAALYGFLPSIRSSTASYDYLPSIGFVWCCTTLLQLGHFVSGIGIMQNKASCTLQMQYLHSQKTTLSMPSQGYCFQLL
jgi:hypothetical protein